MDYNSRSLRYCRWCASRLPSHLRLDALYCPKRCRGRAYRARRGPGRNPSPRHGSPQAEAAPALASPGDYRQEVDRFLLRLAGKAIGVVSDALEQNDPRVAEWVLERAVVRHSKPGSPPEKSARMTDEEAKAELERVIAEVEAELEEEERDTGVDPESSSTPPSTLPPVSLPP